MVKMNGVFEEYLREWLKDPENAAAFLNSVIEDEKREFFLLALRNVVKASGGMTFVADMSDISRTTLYRALSRRGNPDFSQVTTLLNSMGLRLTVEPLASS